MGALETKAYTPEDLLTLPDGDRYELVDGQLLERDMGARSSWVGGLVYHLLTTFTMPRRLGWVFPADASYQCFPDDPNKVRKPDASFIRFGRLLGEKLPRGHIRIHPDLTVEVVSPNDLFTDVIAKVEDHHAAGVSLVWVIDPERRLAYVCPRGQPITRLGEGDELTGGDVLPGFRCRVGDLFPPSQAS